ncbi:MAG: hypothetical protein ACT452_08920 [Microthrixaceae bacterium]
MARLRWAVAGALVAGVVGLMATGVAHADVVDPSGACKASGHWVAEGVTRTSADYSSSDLIEIPQKDKVQWAGSVGTGQQGARREISGEVEIDIAGVGSATIDDWGGSSVKYANKGNKKYDLPDVLLNVKIRLHGEHREAPEGSAAFKKVCGGSVYVQAKGATFSNPLSIASAVGMLLSGAGLVSAGMVRKPA